MTYLIFKFRLFFSIINCNYFCTYIHEYVTKQINNTLFRIKLKKSTLLYKNAKLIVENAKCYKLSVRDYFGSSIHVLPTPKGIKYTGVLLVTLCKDKQGGIHQTASYKLTRKLCKWQIKKVTGIVSLLSGLRDWNYSRDLIYF